MTDRPTIDECPECGCLNGWHNGWCKRGVEAWEDEQKLNPDVGELGE